MHCAVGVVPTRSYTPRDKAKVESGVLPAEPAMNVESQRHAQLPTSIVDTKPEDLRYGSPALRVALSFRQITKCNAARRQFRSLRVVRKG